MHDEKKCNYLGKQKLAIMSILPILCVCEKLDGGLRRLTLHFSFQWPSTLICPNNIWMISPKHSDNNNRFYLFRTSIKLIFFESSYCVTYRENSIHKILLLNSFNLRPKLEASVCLLISSSIFYWCRLEEFSEEKQGCQ